MSTRAHLIRTTALAAVAVALAGCTLTINTAGQPQWNGPAPNGPGTMMGGSGTMMGASGPMMGGPGTMMSGRGSYTGSCTVPQNLPGTNVSVMVGDMGMGRMMMGGSPSTTRMMLRTRPVTAPAGDITFLVSNMGWRTHELVILPLVGGQQAGARVPGPDGQVDESGSLGEASNPCGEGTGDGITSGSAGWVTVNLSPGRYELVCNMPNHYSAGMWQEFVVT